MELALSVFESIKSYLVVISRDKSRYRSVLLVWNDKFLTGMVLLSGVVFTKPSLGHRLSQSWSEFVLLIFVPHRLLIRSCSGCFAESWALVAVCFIGTISHLNHIKSTTFCFQLCQETKGGVGETKPIAVALSPISQGGSKSDQPRNTPSSCRLVRMKICC